MTQPTLHLVDASMYVFRAWHSMPDEFHDADGWPTNAVHGFARFLLDLVERERPRHIAVAFDEALVARQRELDPDASPAVLDKDRQRFSHAPLVIAVIAVLDPHDTKIPELERLLSAGSVCFALLQAAQALGFGATWLTGWPAYDPAVLRLLGVGADERVVGFVHIGTPAMEAPERERPDPRALLSDLSL